jgi:hypothetical protein
MIPHAIRAQWLRELRKTGVAPAILVNRLTSGPVAIAPAPEYLAFTLNPNLAGPNVPVGSTATLHWLQILNEDRQYGGLGFLIADQQGFWQVDNGDVNGGAVSATETGSGTKNGNHGPYYDSTNNSAVTGSSHRG